MKTPWTPARLALWAALPMAHTSEVERRLTMILDPTRSRRQTTRRILLVTLGVGAAALLPLAALRPAVRARETAAAPARETEAASARRLQRICTLIELYRTTHNAAYPPAFGANSLIANIAAHPQTYELPDRGVGNTAQATSFFTGSSSPVIAYFVRGRRPDGARVGAPKPTGTRDVLAYTNLYVRNQPRGGSGFYLVLWDDGSVGRIPVNRALQVPAYDVIGPAGATGEARRQGEKQIAFPGQAGLS